jgi:DNA (cytosine-5)-methyltransferase 1
LGVSEGEQFTLNASAPHAVAYGLRSGHQGATGANVWEEATGGLEAGGQPMAVAFSCKDSGQDAGEEAPTLPAMGHDQSHANGGGQVAVAYTTKLHNTHSNQAGKLYEDYSPSFQEHSPAPAALLPAAVRRLTPTECERLQAFPDGFTCLCGVEPYTTWDCRCPDGPRYAALGNAVTTSVIEWLGRRLMEANGT